MDPRVLASVALVGAAAAALHCARAGTGSRREETAAAGDVRRMLAALPMAHSTLLAPMDVAGPCILVLPRHLA